jgi:hypothetical protein
MHHGTSPMEGGRPWIDHGQPWPSGPAADSSKHRPSVHGSAKVVIAVDTAQHAYYSSTAHKQLAACKCYLLCTTVCGVQNHCIAERRCRTNAQQVHTCTDYMLCPHALPPLPYFP